MSSLSRDKMESTYLNSKIEGMQENMKKKEIRKGL